jgi:FMN phosphatase YigB (HAD superfamily)
MVLGNPIPLPEQAGRTGSGAPILFAPVRGIRRKNLGELVFLSALAPQGTRLAVSRAPLNPSALPVHDTWRKFAMRQQLPIGFDVVDRFSPAAGAGSDFETWTSHATHFITTSVSEGFGLPFLEAAAHGKPLIGRNLPHITAEHASHGIRSGNLYEQLLIPADWIDLTILRDHLHTTLERNFRCYRRPLSSRTCGATFDALIHDGWLDFGNLPEALQQGVIERMADLSNRSVPQVRTGGTSQCAEDWLRAAIDNRTPTATPDQLAPYSAALYQRKLVSHYSLLAEQAASPVRFLPPAAILTSRLAPDSFHFLLSALKPAPAFTFRHRAVIFDIYGTLLIAPAGGVQPDRDADPLLRSILERFGHKPPESPSTELHAAVLRHHAAAGVPHPEIDLRVLWREILALEPCTDTAPLVQAIEAAWHPARLMPGAETMIRHLAASGVSLGLLSNAQCNTLSSLGGIADLFAPELTILSYQHGRAKPSPELFAVLTDRLAGRGIHPGEALFIGNDPVRDIAPAAAHGFKTALFTGHPDSIRPGVCAHDFEIRSWTGLVAL